MVDFKELMKVVKTDQFHSFGENITLKIIRITNESVCVGQTDEISLEFLNLPVHSLFRHQWARSTLQ